MKRWLVFVLAGLAVVVLLSPGVVGLIAERAVEQQLELAASGNPQADPETLRFERGWFTSAGRHRVPIDQPDLARLIGFVTPGAEPRDTAVIVIDTRLEHGLVPIGGAGRDLAALRPALASGLSTLELEAPDGSLLPIPGVLKSRVGLTGGATVTYRLPAGERSGDGYNVRWQAIELTLGSTPDGSVVDVDAGISGWQVDAGTDAHAIDRARLTVTARPTRHGYALGEASLVANGVAKTGGADALGLDRLRIDLHAGQDGESVAANLELQVTGLETAAGRYAVDLDVAASRLDAASLGPLLRGILADPATPAFVAADVDLRRLLSLGASLDLERLVVATPAGDVDARARFDLPALAETAPWPRLLLALTASADVALPTTLAGDPALADALRPLMAGGFLVPDGDLLRLRAEYRDGIATVNGAPLPLSQLID